MSTHHAERFPPAFLWAAGGLVILSLAGAALVSSGLLPQVANPATLRAEQAVAPVVVRDLRFLDAEDGSVMVETMTGERLTVVAAFSENGFIRGVMRGMARDRHLNGVGPHEPFRLTLWANDTITLSDPTTGREVELSGFGPTNRAAFAALLPYATAKAAASGMKGAQ